MYNLIEYSSSYSKTTGNLWFYSKDELTAFSADIANTNNFKYFMYKAKLLENTEADGANGILKNGADNTNANPNNIIFTIKDTKLYVPVVNLSARDNQKLTKLLSKGFERSVYWNEHKIKNEIKI